MNHMPRRLMPVIGAWGYLSVTTDTPWDRRPCKSRCSSDLSAKPGASCSLKPRIHRIRPLIPRWSCSSRLWGKQRPRAQSVPNQPAGDYRQVNAFSLAPLDLAPCSNIALVWL